MDISIITLALYASRLQPSSTHAVHLMAANLVSSLWEMSLTSTYITIAFSAVWCCLTSCTLYRMYYIFVYIMHTMYYVVFCMFIYGYLCNLHIYTWYYLTLHRTSSHFQHKWAGAVGRDASNFIMRILSGY